MKAEFPKYLYHPALEPIIVETEADELACLESGWVDTPAAFEEVEILPPPPKK